MLVLNAMYMELGAVIGVIILYTLKNIKHIFLVVLLTKLFVLIINLASRLFFTEEKKMQFIDSLKQILKNMIISEE